MSVGDLSVSSPYPTDITCRWGWGYFETTARQSAFSSRL